MIAAVLADPRCILLDAEKEAELFEEPARRYLPGVSILAVPLMPSDGELIGLVILYRKGEQPFMQSDLALADAIAAPTALAVRRNE